MTELALGAFRFDPAAGTLRRDGEAVPLGGRALAVLTALAAREGTVTKETLLTAAWPGVTVEEGNLTVQIAGLRKLLGEDAIVTVPRTGYRLRRDAPLPEAATLPRIALMPFQTLGSPDDRYFADGLADEIVTLLGRFRDFVVLSRQAGEAAAADPLKAGLRYTVEGSLRRSGDRLRLSARLVRCLDGVQLWAHGFDGSAADIFEFQDRIAEAVTGAVTPEIEAAEIRAARERPASAGAYDLYLQALANAQTLAEAPNREGIAQIRRALEIEPGSARYLAHLGWLLLIRLISGWPPVLGDDAAHAREAVLSALSTGTTDARVLADCSDVLIHVSDQFDLALSVARRALADNPNNLLINSQAAIIELHCGSLEESVRLSRRALELSPNDPLRHVTYCALAHVAIIHGQAIEAAALAAQGFAINMHYEPTVWMLIAANALAGRPDEASRHLAYLRQVNPGATVASIRAGQPQKDPGRIEPFLAGLSLAGLPET